MRRISQISQRDVTRAVMRLSLFLFAVSIASAAEPHDPDYDYDPPKPGTYTLPVIKPAADGALLDANNKPINLRDLTHGKITVLSFIYTRCAAPKACPYATGVLSQLHDLSAKDESLAKNMRLVEHQLRSRVRHAATSRHLFWKCSRRKIRLRMAFRYRPVPHRTSSYSRRLRPGGRQTP